MGGVATGGAVLATVVEATDLDYQLVVLEDCCADGDEDLHETLVEKFFKKRGSVVKSDELSALVDG
jgi:nicotinamidase-related amidase